MPWHIGLIRPYAPNPNVDWAHLDFSLDRLGRFANPAVQDEFTRFANRDMVTNFISLGFAVALFAWPLLFPSQFETYFAVLLCGVGVVVTMLSVVMALLVFYGDFDTQRARRRSIVATVATLLVAVACTMADVRFFVTCRETRDLFSSWLPYMNPDPANYLHDCIRIINPYLTVCMSVNIGIGTFHPLTAFTISIVAIFLAYSGYYTAPGYDLLTAGETWKELGLKMIIYWYALALTVALQAVVYRESRLQFEAAAKTYLLAKLTKKRSEDVDALLCAMVPLSALDRLMNNVVVSDDTVAATVLFSDMVQFTAWSSVRSTAVVVSMLNTLCIQLDAAARDMGIEKIKTIGDAYWAVAGLPEYVADHADKMVKFGLHMHRLVRSATSGKSEWGSVMLRVGVHSGPLRGGILGTSRPSYEVFGETSDVAEECEKGGVAERVNVSEATRCLLGSEFAFDAHSTVDCGGRLLNTFLVRYAVISEDEFGSRLTTLRRGRHQRGEGSLYSQTADTPKSNASASAATDRTAKQVDPQEIARRRAFVEKKAARVAELEQQAESSDDVARRVSQRRFEWILFWFKDEVMEAEYHAFVAETQLWMRRLTRGLMLGVIVLQILIAGLDRPASVGPASWALLGVALAMDLGLLVSSWVDVLPLPLEALGFFVVILLDTVGCGVMRDSIIGNDPLYIFTFVSPLVSTGAPALPSAAILPMLFCCCGIPVWYFTYNSILFATVFAFVSFAMLIAMLGGVTFEKMLRQQFVERKAQQHEHELQLRREQEQRALLEAMVPPHVIVPLQQWLETDMDVTKTIAKQYSRVCVGFMEIEEQPGHGLHDKEGASTADNAFQWLFDAHNMIDAAIAAEDGAFDKIKTIGRKVMLAGSFRESDAPAAAMLRCVSALMRGGLSIKVGLHVGEVMGAVLGTERLCFDIFGDTVNVASRVLTTLGPGESAAMSEEFYECLQRESDDCGMNATTTANGSGLPSVVTAAGATAEAGLYRVVGPMRRAAKGKGEITIRLLQVVAASGPRAATEGPPL